MMMLARRMYCKLNFNCCQNLAPLPLFQIQPPRQGLCDSMSKSTSLFNTINSSVFQQSQESPSIQTVAEDLKDTEATEELGEGTSVRESMEDEEDNGDAPDEVGISDEDGHNEAHNDQKDQQWKPPTIDAAHAAHQLKNRRAVM